MTKPNSIDEAIEFFRNLGAEPIIIDPNDSESIQQGLNTITERITEDTDNPTTDNKPASNT